MSPTTKLDVSLGSDRLAAKIDELYSSDPEFAAARPSAEITAAIAQPGIRLAQVLRTVMEGYADRPAIGRRTFAVVEDATGTPVREILPVFETLTYRQLWERAQAIAAAWADGGVKAGDCIAALGFSSVDYVSIELASIALGTIPVPLPINTPVSLVASIIDETKPVVMAASAEQLSIATEALLSDASHMPAQVLVFDHQPDVEQDRKSLQAAKSRLAEAGSTVTVEILDDAVSRGAHLTPVSAPKGDENSPALLIYTSGSTGTPKGAIWSERMVGYFWSGYALDYPAITINYMPMNHGASRTELYRTLASGGTAYFTARSDLSDLLDDIALVRPTIGLLVPRIWEMLFGIFRGKIDQLTATGMDPEQAERQARSELSQQILGGRLLSVITGSAALADDVRAFAASLPYEALYDFYSQTEAGPKVLINGVAQQPPVTEYKLVDVPELEYFSTDKPYPRGELYLKSELQFGGYYKRPELTASVIDPDGFLMTGDIFAKIGPDRLMYVDRRNNVQKLSNGEFVAISNLEAAFGANPAIEHIYLYGDSAQPYLVAVIVPSAKARGQAGSDTGVLKSVLAEALQKVAADHGLQSYEVPRNFIIEMEPFSLENGLLTALRKLARPKLKSRYGDQLESLYSDMAEGQKKDLRALPQGIEERSVLETVLRATAATLGLPVTEINQNAHFQDLGGDSLSALSLSKLLTELFGVDMSVPVIASAANDLAKIAQYIEAHRGGNATRPTACSVHGEIGSEIRASDLTLDHFIDPALFAAAADLPRPTGEVNSVLVTGANGFLGRFLTLHWLERLAPTGGKVYALVRGKDAAAARARLDEVFDRGDSELLAAYQRLAARGLEVLAGDLADEALGVDAATWQHLAETVDLICHPGALVNHVLGYEQLFAPNVLGTAELIRLAITTKLKPFSFVSTGGTVMAEDGSVATPEDGDIREMMPSTQLSGYAPGYRASKWAGEVLLREAHDLTGLPVVVFRSDMIMAPVKYSGQINVPDFFTRLLYSIIATGVAPYSFYELDVDGKREKAHFDGLPADLMSEAIAAISLRAVDGHVTYNVSDPHGAGVSYDTFVDWLIEDGYAITRIHDYRDWLLQFQNAMQALPAAQQQHSVLPVIAQYSIPQRRTVKSIFPSEGFHAAVEAMRLGGDGRIPPLSKELILKYPRALKRLGLL